MMSLIRLFLFSILFLFVSGAGLQAQTCDNWLGIPTQPGYVSVGDLDVPGNQITVEALFVRTQPYSHILYAGDLVSKHVQWTDVNYLLRPSTAEITTSTGYYITPEVCEIELNRIYHVAMVYDGSSLKFYRDGYLLSQIAATGDLFQNNWQTRIGLYEAGVFPENLLGYINEVRIWNVARTQQQIRDHMGVSLSSPTTEPGLLAYYTFDNLLNKQGNAAWNGTLGGSASINNTVPTCNWQPVRCPNTTDSIIINHYTEVTAFEACSNFLDVTDATAFNVGDTVLLFQMKGAIVDSSNTAAFGTITEYRNAGNYEYNYIKSKTGNRLELLNEPERDFDFALNLVQLIRVPYFQNYETSAVLTCLPWDGRKGGVLAFNVANTLTLNEHIDVSGRGFRGGADPFTNPASLFCYENQFYYPPNPDLASGKGEGIADISRAKSFGKGALANGGGGGNSHNSGGGGGSNAATGGFGGYNYELAPCNTQVPFDNRGFGGKQLTYSNAVNRLYLGGGGGAGQSNNQGFEAKGGGGGGIVIITADRLVSNGHSILAAGTDGVGCTGSNNYCHEGMGGGGGGGAVVLDIATYTDATTISAQGGKGGDMISAGLGRLGPGGGGGGGVVWLSAATPPANISVQVNGGLNGTNVAYSNDSWGAITGNAGLQLTGLQLPIANQPFAPNIDSVRINQVQVGCSSFDFDGLAYVKSVPVVSWLWDLGDGTTSTLQNLTHVYSAAGTYTVKLVASDMNGCKDSILIDVFVEDGEFDFSYEQNACNPFTVAFAGTGSGPNPFWDFGDGATSTGNLQASHTFAPGVYTIKYFNGNGTCADTVRKVITIKLDFSDIVLTPDTTICTGSTKMIRGVLSDDFCWSPTSFLDGFDSNTPTTSTPGNITYYYTARASGPNLLLNGDFSQGNVGFSSSYHYAPASGLAAGSYHVTSNVSAWHSGLSACSDHSGNNGNMLLANGSLQSSDVIWSQTVNISANTAYRFLGYFQSLTTVNAPILSLLLNGKKLLTVNGTNGNACVWSEMDLIWNSANQTSVLLEIVNESSQEAGNDFALDDLMFAETGYYRDSIQISVETPVVQAVANPTVCSGTPVQLSANGAASYSWTPGIYLDDPNSATPTATVFANTEFIVSGTTSNGCVARDTVQVNLFPPPSLTISNDTTICKNNSVGLFVTGGVSYNWSPAASLNNPQVSNPIASPLTNTVYVVEITDGNGCRTDDSVRVDIHPDPIFTVSGDFSLCKGDSVQLSASGGDHYLWSPATGLGNSNIPDPMASPQANTEYTVLISEDRCQNSATLSTRVVVLPLPNVAASRSNDIDCTVSQSQLNATGAIEYSWAPANSLNNAGIRNPVASPTATTVYQVSGKDLAGCVGVDSVEVKVQKINESKYWMPSAFTPNNDGLNDCYGVRFWGIIDNFDFSIYNRWGELVFQTKDPNGCWDGRYKGVAQDAGVFVYMIRASNNCSPAIFRKGTFTLVR